MDASGTACTATRCATSGAAQATVARVRVSASPARATSTSPTGARPFASINFVTAHDGFTLADLVSYNDKHNEANGEDNRDGTDDNRSWNCGVEGADRRPRGRTRCARGSSATSSATLFLSQGVPMLLGGDELGRTQRGNNNAWCQDNEISWFDWEPADAASCSSSRAAADRLRREHPAFRRRAFLTGTSMRGSGLPDVWWFRPDGRKMTQRDWSRGDARALGVFLNGDEIPTHRRAARTSRDDSFLLLFNGHFEPIAFLLPTRRFGPLGGRAGDGRGRAGGRARQPRPRRRAGPLADAAPKAVGSRRAHLSRRAAVHAVRA